jgi:hypothetical protein
MVNIPPVKMVIWGMVYYCFTSISIFEVIELGVLFLCFASPQDASKWHLKWQVIFR